MAVQCEGRTFRLHDVERLQIVPRRAAVFMVEAQRRGRCRRRRFVHDFQDSVFDEINDRNQSLDRASVGVVVRFVAQVDDALEDAVLSLPLRAEIAGRPQVEKRQINLLFAQAASSHRRVPAGVGADRSLSPFVLVK